MHRPEEKEVLREPKPIQPPRGSTSSARQTRKAGLLRCLPPRSAPRPQILARSVASASSPVLLPPDTTIDNRPSAPADGQYRLQAQIPARTPATPRRLPPGKPLGSPPPFVD